MLINSIILKKIWYLIFYAIVFLIPSNLFFKFNLSDAYVNNLLVDYLIPKIYLIDLVIILFLVYSFLLQYFLKIKIIDKNLFYKFIPFFLLTSIVIDFNYTNSIITALRFSLYFIFTIIVFKNRVELINKNFKIALNLTILFQSFVAFYQYYFQKSFYGFLFFGESNLNNFYGITKTNFFADSRILPYGTTPHPNILAGFMAIYTTISLVKKEKSVLDYLAIFFGLLAILTTESLSAIIAVSVTTLIYLLKDFLIKKIPIKNTFLLSGFIILIGSIASLWSINILNKNYENQSLDRRDYLNRSAMNMIFDKPVFGTKINSFTRFVEEYTSKQEVVRFVQPVHNFFLLAIAEFGLLPVVLLISYLYFLTKTYNFSKIKNRENLLFLLALIPIFNLDHYLYTMPAGNLSMILLFITVFDNN